MQSVSTAGASGWKFRRAASTSCKGTGGLAGSDEATNVSSVAAAIGVHVDTYDHAACPRTGLLARRAKPLEHAWVRIASQRLVRTSALGMDPADRQRLDFVACGVTPRTTTCNAMQCNAMHRYIYIYIYICCNEIRIPASPAIFCRHHTLCSSLTTASRMLIGHRVPECDAFATSTVLTIGTNHSYETLWHSASLHGRRKICWTPYSTARKIRGPSSGTCPTVHGHNCEVQQQICTQEHVE